MINKNSGLNRDLENRFCEVFVLPDSDLLRVSEEEYRDEEGRLNKRTNFNIKIKNKNFYKYSIQKSASEIGIDDINCLKESIESYLSKNYPIRSRVYKFFGWWFIFAGAITVFSVCPICGQTGCPVGVGTTGIIAGLLSLIKTGGKNHIRLLFRLFNKIIKKLF